MAKTYVALSDIVDATTLAVDETADTVTVGELITRGPIHDVRAYGADPTGTTDSLAAINDAISALPSTGGVLLFPPGIFNVSGTITVGKPVTFQGSGGSHFYSLNYWTSATVIRRSGTSTTPIVQLGTGLYRRGVNFRDISFDGEGYATKALDLALWHGSDITNVGVKSCTQTALHLRAEDGAEKGNCMFNTITGFSSQNTPNGIKLSGAADHSANCCHMTFTRTLLQTTGISIVIEDADNVAFYTTILYDTGDPGTYCVDLGSHARGNYFYHLQAGRSGGVGGVIVRTTVSNGGNVIYGYDRENGQPEPTFEAGASSLEWTESGRNASGWNIQDLNLRTNNVYVTSRNAAGTADVNMWKVNTSNELETNTATRFTDGTNLAVGTGSGTKIGTATTQKIGFFNATPIVQPNSTADLKDAMIALGFLASGGATPLNLDGGTLSVGVSSFTANVTNQTAFIVNPTISVSSSFNAGANVSPTFKPTVGSLTQQYAMQFIPSITDNGGTSNSITGPIHGIFARIDLAATYAGTVDTAHGITLSNPSKNGGSGVITTYKGLHIDTLTTGGTNWGIYVNGNACFFGGGMTLGEAGNIALGTTTGTKIGTSTTQKLGFWNATPVVRPTGWGAATGTATRTTYATGTATVTQLAERLKALIDDLTTIGVIGA